MCQTERYIVIRCEAVPPDNPHVNDSQRSALLPTRPLNGKDVVIRKRLSMQLSGQTLSRIVGHSENAVPEKVSGGDHSRLFAQRLPTPRVPVLINDPRASSRTHFVGTAESKRKKPLALNQRLVGSHALLRNLVSALARVTFRRLDLDAVLLAGGRDEAPDAVRLPVGRLHDLGESGALRAGDHVQDLRALALGTRDGSLLGGGLAGGLGGLLAALRACLGCLLRRGGLGFGSLLGAVGGFLALGRALLLAGGFLGGGLVRRDVRALCRNGGGFVGGVGF